MAAVGDGPELFVEVGGVGGVGPGVAVDADFAVAEEVIEQDELFGELVMVGRDLAAEDGEAGVAVTLLEIAEDLVVSPVFLDDVDDVFNGRADAFATVNSRVTSAAA